LNDIEIKYISDKKKNSSKIDNKIKWTLFKKKLYGLVQKIK